MQQSQKTDFINQILIYLRCRISLDMSWSCHFGLKLIHMNQKYVFLFFSLIESIKGFESGCLKQGWSDNRKQTYFFALQIEGTLWHMQQQMLKFTYRIHIIHSFNDKFQLQ